MFDSCSSLVQPGFPFSTNNNQPELCSMILREIYFFQIRNSILHPNKHREICFPTSQEESNQSNAIVGVVIQTLDFGATERSPLSITHTVLRLYDCSFDFRVHSLSRFMHGQVNDKFAELILFSFVPRWTDLFPIRNRHSSYRQPRCTVVGVLLLPSRRISQSPHLPWILNECDRRRRHPEGSAANERSPLSGRPHGSIHGRSAGSGSTPDCRFCCWNLFENYKAYWLWTTSFRCNDRRIRPGFHKVDPKLKSRHSLDFQTCDSTGQGWSGES